MSTSYNETKEELETALKEGNLSAIKTFSKKIRDLDDDSKNIVSRLVDQHISDPNIKKSILFDFGLALHEQKLLQEKMIKYLEYEVARLTKEIEKYKTTEDYKNRMEVINRLKNSPIEAPGECVGLSTSWGTGKRIEDEPKSKESSSVRDDTIFFYETWKKLALWDEKADFSKSEKSDIERFISNVRLYQNPAVYIFSEEGGMQLDLSITLSDTKRGTPVQAFKESIPCTKEMLESRLEKLVKPKSMIFVSCASKECGHMMAIYQNERDGKIYFFDPNADKGEVYVTNMQQLSEEIWKGSNPESFAKVMSGWDPIDKEFRQDIGFTIYRFPGDPEYQYPNKQEFGVSISEFLKTIQENTWLRHLHKGEKAKSLISALGEDKIFDLLSDDKVLAEIKSILVSYVILNNENISPYLARYILIEQKQFIDELLKKKFITENSVESLKVLANQFLDLNKQNLIRIFEKKRHLTTSEVFLFLGDNPGKLELVEKFLQHSAFYVSPDLGFEIFSAVEANLEQGHLEIAKKLLELGADKFKSGLSVEQLENLRSPEVAKFMYEKYDQFYQNVWGASPLQFLPQKINYKNIQYRKEKVMNSVGGLLANEQQQNKIVEELSAKALELKSFLTLDEALTILSVVSGDSNLAKELLNNCIKDDMTKGFGLVLAVGANLERGDLETAKTIVNIVFERFKQGLSLQSIEGLGNEKFATFMYENYGDYYPNKFGQSELYFMPFIIVAKREHAKKRAEVMKEITGLLKPEVEKTEKSIIEATEHAVEIAKLLTLNDVLTVLALKPGDKILAKKLLDICIEQHRKIDNSYLDKEKFARVLELNMNNPEVAKLVIETVASEFNVEEFALYSGKDFGSKINTYMRELVSRRKESVQSVTDENILELKKLQEIAEKTKLKKEKEGLKKVRYASDLFTDYVSKLQKNLVRDNSSKKNSVESWIEIMCRIHPNQKTFHELEQAKSELLGQYDYSVKYILEWKEGMNRYLKDAQSFKSLALEHLVFDGSNDKVLSEINATKRIIEEQMLAAEKEVRSSIDNLQLLQEKLKSEYDSLSKKLDSQVNELENKKQNSLSTLNEAYNEFILTNQEINDASALTLKALGDIMADMQKKAKENPESILEQDGLEVAKIADNLMSLIDAKFLKVIEHKSSTLEIVVEDAYENQLIFEPGMNVAIKNLHDQQSKTEELVKTKTIEISELRHKVLELWSQVRCQIREKEIREQREQHMRELKEELERDLIKIEEESREWRRQMEQDRKKSPKLMFSTPTVQEEKTDLNDTPSKSNIKPQRHE